MNWKAGSLAVNRAARRMNIEELRQAMDDLNLPYERELMTTWEQSFYEDMLENVADGQYRFSFRQLREVFKMREKYDLEKGEINVREKAVPQS